MPYLIKNAKNPISIIDINPSEAVLNWILQNLFLIADLPLILKEYEQYSERNKLEVTRIAIKNIDTILSNQYLMPKRILDTVFDAADIDTDKKLRILAYHASVLKRDEMIKALKTLNQKRFLCLFEGRRPFIEKTDTNEILLTSLKRRRWISSFSVDKINPNMYRVYGRKR